MSSEKICLNLNDFQQNVTKSFKYMRDDSDFCDVTLASEDNQQIKAHKVILAAGSTFFMEIVKSYKHFYPLIYMRGMRAKDLLAIVDFIYLGEANIYQEDLEDFFALAIELKLNGFSENEENYEESFTKTKLEKSADIVSRKITKVPKERKNELEREKEVGIKYTKLKGLSENEKHNEKSYEESKHDKSVNVVRNRNKLTKEQKNGLGPLSEFATKELALYLEKGTPEFKREAKKARDRLYKRRIRDNRSADDIGNHDVEVEMLHYFKAHHDSYGLRTTTPDQSAFHEIKQQPHSGQVTLDLHQDLAQAAPDIDVPSDPLTHQLHQLQQLLQQHI